MKKIQHLFLIFILLFSGNASNAQNTKIDSLLFTLSKGKDDTNKVNVLIELSGQYRKMSDYKSANLYADSAYKLSDKLSFKTGIIKAYNSRGFNYWFQHRMPDALGSYLSALKVAKEINDSSSIAAAYCNIGVIYQSQDNMPKALDNYLLALRISEEINDKKLMAVCHNDMAMIYVSLKDYSEALNHCKAAIKIEEENHDKGIASSEEIMASVYMEQASYDEALRYYLDAVKTPAQEHDEWGLARLFNLIGNVYMLKGDYQMSTNYLENALRISIEHNYTDLQASGYYRLCELAMRQHRTAEANEFLQKDLVLQKQTGGSAALGDAYEMLSRIDSLEGNYKNAYLNYHLALKYRDSTMTEETARKIENARMNFEFGEKEAAAKAEQDKKDAIAAAAKQKQKYIRNSFMGGFAIVMLFSIVVFNQKRRIGIEKERSDELLLNILPSETAEELKATGAAKAKSYDMVTVLFTDFKNFTQASEKMSAEELVNEIHYCYSEFDKIISKHGIEKIKTIGDSYMCAGGLPVENKTNPVEVVRAALEIQQFIAREKEERQKNNKPFFEIRIGINTGPVVAGIVGIKKFAYDIWGDTVNIASRMESSSEVGKVNISGSTYHLVKDEFTCTHRGKIDAKNKGMIDMYFVEGFTSQAS